ncbi:MAG TPA: R3H domain-containing nucleic acid-binding protein, partial [Thermomicrobiales bacterium]|nr:R3H domain-containing nucleic acid-binding protein [Thermomicrobiales bacterium]
DIRSRQNGGEPPKRRPIEPEPDEEPSIAVTPPLPGGRGTPDRPLRIYPFGVSRIRLESSIAQFKMQAVIVRDLRDADLVLTLKNYYRRKPQPLREAEARGTAVYVLRSNTAIQMSNVLASLLPPSQRPNPGQDVDEASNGNRRDSFDSDTLTTAMLEAEEAISAVMDGAPVISLSPQLTYVRKLQHQLADRYNVGSRSRGKEPHRRVEVYRQGVQ